LLPVGEADEGGWTGTCFELVNRKRLLVFLLDGPVELLFEGRLVARLAVVVVVGSFVPA
jgi:hypothetical protein